MCYTSSRKSPFKIPAMSATPPGSTSSMYCKPGHRFDGIISINGEAALAPLRTKPNPRLPLWRTALRGSPGTLKKNAFEKNSSTFLSTYIFSFGTVLNVSRISRRPGTRDAVTTFNASGFRSLTS